MDKIEKELGINNESLWHLEQEVRNYAQKSAKYYRWASQAQRKVNDKTLALEIVTATIVDEIRTSENTPPSALSEIRRSRVALDERYQAVKTALFEAMEENDYVQGIVKAWEAKGYRLKEVIDISMEQLPDGPKIYSKKEPSIEEQIRESEERL